MGTQGPGRKRIPNREKLTAEDDALNQIAREAEARLAAKRAARAEAREIRMKELERQQKEISDDEERMSVGSRGSLRVEERPDRDFLDKGSRTASTLSAATLASLGGASSRRGSCDTSFSVETEASIREIKDSLVEAEDRYRKAMVSNAQLHNDKSTLMYQVDTLREELSDMEEELWEARRHCDHTTKELERERQAHKVLQFQFKEMKETLKQMEELLTKHGVIVSPDVSTNGEAGQGEVESDVSEQSDSRLAEEPLHGGRESMLELRLKKVFEERESLQDQVRLLKSQLDQRQRNGTDGVQNPEEDDLENGMDSHLLDLQRDTNRQISDLKFKLVKSEQEVTALEQNIIRLEGQVTRYKSASESAEKIEDELKVEKRKLQRELRSALDRVDELEVSNSHLSKRLEKMKANRSALLAQQ
ncbi:leucine-rich repeat flightless-interacting protein 2-like isoform X2 [Seriola dumerili]|uniref:leucine-rich repeat flightless-interacting protein 2-like isoform X2 n=1 Tax=Seriola dumerili TaxID=41447 RepID=UPI000BBF0922|nr:leucine-rich repeat flightless-interacting protein 2-like isoform X2 [Seriola dumerili]